VRLQRGPTELIRAVIHWSLCRLWSQGVSARHLRAVCPTSTSEPVRARTMWLKIYLFSYRGKPLRTRSAVPHRAPEEGENR